MTVEIRPENRWNDDYLYVASMQEVAKNNRAWSTYLALSNVDKSKFKEALDWEFVVPLNRLLGIEKSIPKKVALTKHPQKQSIASHKPARSRTLNDHGAMDDYYLILSDLQRLPYQGSHGPTTFVTTKLKWSNAVCRNLYLKLKDELHDNEAPGGGYYYFTAVNPTGKSGFRITVHSKPLLKIGKSETLAILHIDNN